MTSTDSKATISHAETQAAKAGRESLPGRAKKHRKGHIFKRGNVYWLEYKVNGKRFRQSLDTSDVKEARTKRARIMAPFTVATEEEVLQAVKQRIETTTEKQEALSTAHLPQVQISDASGLIDTDETISRFIDVKDAALRDRDFLTQQFDRAKDARDESERTQQEYQSQVHAGRQ
ncbi:MAG: hypothetical protein HN919_22815 [Verrucomicrobia bacterium]|jgi:hypothetical protein|nr:hypothetical protein [Verrucomicrobiota bacterium]MBT7701389.1 hypothetical protein [Verrucomicrobiota bacterium]